MYIAVRRHLLQTYAYISKTLLYTMNNDLEHTISVENS